LNTGLRRRAIAFVPQPLHVLRSPWRRGTPRDRPAHRTAARRRRRVTNSSRCRRTERLRARAAAVDVAPSASRRQRDTRGMRRWVPHRPSSRSAQSGTESVEASPFAVAWPDFRQETGENPDLLPKMLPLPTASGIKTLGVTRDFVSGARGTRTPDLLGAIQALSQLSYSPERRQMPRGSGRQCSPGRPIGYRRDCAQTPTRFTTGRPFMSPRARLASFFILIVVVPVAAVSVLMVWLIGDGERATRTPAQTGSRPPPRAGMTVSVRARPRLRRASPVRGSPRVRTRSPMWVTEAW
jgi:hypothetical protein